MEDEKKDIEKDKNDYEKISEVVIKIIIFGMLCIVLGVTCIDKLGGCIFLGLMIVFIGVIAGIGNQEMSAKEQSIKEIIKVDKDSTKTLDKEQGSQESLKLDKKIAKKFSIKIFIEKIHKKVKTIFSNLCSILSSPITTNVILIIIVCMLSGIKYSVVNNHLSSYDITSAIKDALDDYGFI